MFANRHVGDSPNIWKKVLWSDETKIEFWAIKENAMSGTNPTTLITPRTPCFSSPVTGKLVRIEGMMDGAKYRELLETCFSLPETGMEVHLPAGQWPLAY